MMNKIKFSPLTALLMLLVSSPILEAKSIKGFIDMKQKIAPNFSLKNMNGDTVNSKSLRGRWLFLHFWASWCGPCRKELPSIQRILKNKQLNGIQFVFINMAENEDTVFSFFGKLEIDLPTLLDINGEVTEKYQPRGLPATFIIDPKGKIHSLFFGGRPWHTKDYFNYLKTLSLKTKAKIKTN